MRRVLVDRARSRRSAKRGRDPVQVDALELIGMTDRDAAGILGLEAAMGGLEKANPRQARVVELRFFGGLSIKEAAQVLGIAERSAQRDWQMARIKLREAMDVDSPHA